MMRLAAVIVREFQVGAHLQRDPALRERPLVIVPLPPARGRVQACSLEARELGVRRGMSWAAARSMAPEAVFIEPEPELYEQQAAQLLERLQQLSPRVQQLSPGVFLLDTRGLGRLHASEQAFARQLREALAELGHQQAGVGIADSRYAALVAALGADGEQVVPAGGDAGFLEPLPLNWLPASAELLQRLGQLGIETLGEYARLDSTAVELRFGPEGTRLQRLARGDDPRPLVPSGADERLRRRHELEAPVDALEPLLFGLKRLVDDLLDSLAERGLAAEELTLTLRLDGRAPLERAVRPIRPTLSGRLALDLLRATLARERLEAPVLELVLEATRCVPARAEQLVLFSRRRGNAEAVEGALARLAAMFGPDSVVAARPRDSHRPERQVGWEPWQDEEEAPRRPARRRAAAAGSRPRSEPAPGPATRQLPLRLFDPPLPARVQAVGGQPARIQTTRLAGRVSDSRGPHRLEGEWWSPQAYGRDYYDVSLGPVGRYWIYRERGDGGWFLQGAYD